MVPLVLLTAVCVVTYSFEIIFGLAGTILMLPLLGFVYDSKTLVIYSVLPQILVAVVALARSPLTADRKVMTAMLGFAALGALAGFIMFYTFPGTIFQLLLATAITASGVFLLLAPARAQLGARSRPAFDMLAGASQALFGISGPVVLTRLLATFREKAVVRHYAFSFYLALNSLRAVVYLIRDSYTTEILGMMAFSAPFLALAFWYSNQLHLHVNERLFRRVVSWLILIGGLTLFLQ
jgi:uncharacterized membrane protein YfcA